LRVEHGDDVRDRLAHRPRPEQRDRPHRVLADARVAGPELPDELLERLAGKFFGPLLGGPGRGGGVFRANAPRRQARRKEGWCEGSDGPHESPHSEFFPSPRIPPRERPGQGAIARNRRQPPGAAPRTPPRGLLGHGLLTGPRAVTAGLLFHQEETFGRTW